MSEQQLLKTVFHPWHTAHDGRMVEFGGWHMPVQYSTIVDEHNAVRNAAGLFDIAHMGRLRFTGQQAARFLDYVLTNDLTKIKVGQVRYSLVTNEQGGVLDDVLVYRFEDCWMLVVNASNRLKIVDWLEAHRAGFDVDIEDRTLSHPMLAIQGPRALDVMKSLGCPDAESLRYYTTTETTVDGIPATISRTGYTGEDGFEVIIESAVAANLWERVVETGAEFGLQHCGLGCRDTLRLESAMPLYGHELDENTDPLTAGLEFAVKLAAGEFIGRSVLQKICERKPENSRVGLELDGRRIAREGARIVVGDELVGTVTSGTFSPTLQKSIAMGYVRSDLAEVGRSLEVDVRGKRISATIVELPFYQRSPG